MSDAAELGAFLKARRAALDPADLGLPEGITQRRVAGLRREEIAQLAGISVDYYTRLEQGRAKNVSDSVLDALARAMRLREDEERYMRNLITPPRRGTRTRAPRVRPQLQMLVDAMQTPAVVFGRYLEVLAWNPLGGAITFGPEIPEDTTIPRMFFLDERAREQYPEWDDVAKEVVENLRAESGKYPGDPKLAQLVGELSLGSETFRKLWAAHTVREKAHSSKLVHHPVVGDIRLHYETLRLPNEPDFGLAVYAAEPGSESERALRLLASWITEAVVPSEEDRIAR